MFEGNLAHSISGYGAVALNEANQCTEISYFTAYKVTESSVMLGGTSRINRGTNLKAIDTRYGIGIFSGGGGTAEILDSQVYGEIPGNVDCPVGSPCDHCMAARGVILNMAAEGAHKDREPKWSKLPLFKSSGAMQGDSIYRNLEIIDYPSEFKSCGARQAAVMPFLQPDYTPYAAFDNLILNNVAHDAMTFI